MKSSAAKSHRALSSAAVARAPADLSPRARAAANDEPNARRRTKEPPGPLWVIAIAMAIFFGATALLMMFD
jgi:hypothetical protein